MKPNEPMMNNGIFKILFGDYDRFLTELELMTTIKRKELQDKLTVYTNAKLELFHGQEAIELLINEIQSISDRVWQCQKQIESILNNKEGKSESIK